MTDMRSICKAVAVLFGLGALGLAQQWEIGGLAGGGFLTNSSVTAPLGSATTGFKPGLAVGAFVGQNLYSRLSGELRYGYMKSDLKLSSGGQEVTFNGIAHVIHYDFLLHANRRGAKLQPFVAAGGGVKVYRGTGKEAAYQPLNSFAFLTKTQEWKPLISAGGGVKVSLAPRVLLRAELRDYITPFPKQVIAPARGAKISGWLHDFVPMAGISFTF